MVHTHSRITDSDVQQAGYYLSRQLEQIMPGIYRRKYAPLWAQENSDVIVAVPNLDPGSTSIIETVIEEKGEASELSDNADDIPLVEVSIGENKYEVHLPTLGYKYSVMDLLRNMRSSANITQEKIRQTDRGIRERIHQLLLFGNVKRGTDGLYNNAEVPITTSGYDANTASWQDHIDFVVEELARVSNRNNMTDEVNTMLIPSNLGYKWVSTYQTNDSGKSAWEGIREAVGISNGGSLARIIRVNECRFDILEKFGVKAPGTNEDRVVFLPTARDAVDRMFAPIDYLEPQLRGLHYYVYAYGATTQTMIHYPESLAYSDIPTVNPVVGP